MSIHNAIDFGAGVSSINALIEAGADVNEMHDGETPIYHAIKERASIHIIKALIEAGADVNARCHIENKAIIPLEYTFNKGVADLLTTIKAEDSSAITMNMFNIDIHNPQQYIIENLRDMEVQFNIVCVWKTPMYAAIEQKAHIDIIKELIKAGGDVDAKYYMNSQLYIALKNNMKTDVIETLIEADANIDNIYKDMSALCVAIDMNKPLELIKIIASYNKYLNDGYTEYMAIYPAIRHKDINVLKFIIEANTIFLSHNCKYGKKHPLIYAVDIKADEDRINILIDASLKRNNNTLYDISYIHTTTPLGVAIKRKLPSYIICKLIKGGARIFDSIKYCEEAKGKIAMAIREGYGIDVVKSYIERGEDVNEPYHGNTALDYAKRLKDNTELINLLENAKNKT